MKTALYLDDVRTPTETLPGYHPWNIVRNYNQFEEWIVANGVPDLVSFDHDLAEEHINDYFKQFAEKGFQIPKYEDYKEKTGIDCASFLVEYCQKMNIPLKQCAVHSANPVGAKNIQSFINGFHKHMDQPETCYLAKVPHVIENS
jgi:hypothetical protein